MILLVCVWDGVVLRMGWMIEQYQGLVMSYSVPVTPQSHRAITPPKTDTHLQSSSLIIPGLLLYLPAGHVVVPV